LEVDRKSPEFYFRHQSVVKKLDVDIRTLVVDFQREAVIDVMQVTSRVQSEMMAAVADVAAAAAAAAAHPPAGKVTPSQPQPKIQSA